MQDVFAECCRPGGALDRVDPSRPGGFRAFLYGIIRVVALRFETRPRHRREQSPPRNDDMCEVPADDTSVSLAFDRARARSLLREAAERQAELAGRGPGRGAPVELLRLRFHDGLPIREIARRSGCDPDAVHREYARARQEFKAALADVVLAHQPDGTPGEIERECAALLELFS